SSRTLSRGSRGKPLEEMPVHHLQAPSLPRDSFPRRRAKPAPRLPQRLRLPPTTAACTRGVGMSGSENGSPPTQADEISLPALRVRQGEGRTLYTFAVDGKLLNQFAAISRLRRDVAGAILGYQRPEVLSHIAEIRRYLESSAPMIPNAIVIAFDERVRFSPHSGLKGSPYAEHGELRIPLGD